mgnify:CR=1 FL=1
MSPRYTPPKSRDAKASPLWFMTLIGALIVAGLTIVVLNQMDFLPGGPQARYLILGFVLFIAGFTLTTQLR